MAPGQILFHPRPAQLPHAGTRRLVVQESHDGLGVVALVVGLDVHRGLAGRHARLTQVEGDHGQLEGHVLHRLVHRRHVVERIFRVRRQTHVRARQDAGDELVWRPPGELDVAGQAEFVAQPHQFGEAVSRADQREGDVGAAEFAHHDVRRPHHDVDAVLRAHHADVRDEEPAPAAQRGLGRDTPQALRVRASADDRDVVGGLAASRHGDVAIGAVGGDHVIRGPVSRALQGQQPFVGQLRAMGKSRLVKFRTQIVVIEHELGAFDGAESKRDRPEDVRRVAGLNYREAARSPCLESQPGRREE
jgi:hypothetical protein